MIRITKRDNVLMLQYIAAALGGEDEANNEHIDHRITYLSTSIIYEKSTEVSVSYANKTMQKARRYSKVTDRAG